MKNKIFPLQKCTWNKHCSMFLHTPQQRTHPSVQLTSTILPFTFTEIIQDCSLRRMTANYVKHCSTCRTWSGIKASIINTVRPKAVQWEASENRLLSVKSTSLGDKCIHAAWISEDALDWTWWLNCFPKQITKEGQPCSATAWIVSPGSTCQLGRSDLETGSTRFQ